MTGTRPGALQDLEPITAYWAGTTDVSPYRQDTYCFVLRTGDGKGRGIVEYLVMVAVEEAICCRRIVDGAAALIH